MTVSPPPESFKITRNPTPGTTRRNSLLGFSLIGFLLLVGLVFLLVITTSAAITKAGSTYEKSLSGYRHWFIEMKAAPAARIQRWQKPYSKLTGTGQTLIQIWGDQPAESSFSLDHDSPSEIQTWVEQGNTLIQLAWQGTATGAPFSSQLSSPVGRVLIETTRRQQPLPAEAQSLLSDRFGSVIWERDFGDGKLISIAYPWLAANAHRSHLANFKLLTNLAQQQPGPIWVDEWLHGYRDPTPTEVAERRAGDAFDYLLATPVMPLILQGLLIGLVLFWGLNRRFGPTFPPLVPQSTNNERYIQAMAAVLRQAEHTDYTQELLAQQLRHQLSKNLGMATSQTSNLSAYQRENTLRSDQQLANAWSEQTGRPAQELLDLLEQPQKPGRFRESNLRTWAAKVAQVLRAQPGSP